MGSVKVYKVSGVGGIIESEIAVDKSKEPRSEQHKLNFFVIDAIVEKFDWVADQFLVLGAITIEMFLDGSYLLCNHVDALLTVVNGDLSCEIIFSEDELF